MNQQLVNYIRQQFKAGEEKQAIMDILLAQGWKQNDLDEAFALVEGEQSAAAAPSFQPPSQTQLQSSFQSPLQPQTQFQSQPASVKAPSAQTPQIPAGFSNTFPNDAKFDKNTNSGAKDFKSILAFLGLALGAVSLISWFLPWVGIVFAVIAVILSIIGLMGSKKIFAIIGLILSVIGLAGFIFKLVVSRPNVPVEPSVTNEENGTQQPANNINPDNSTGTPNNNTNENNSNNQTTNNQPASTQTIQPPSSVKLSTSALLEPKAYYDAAGGFSIQPPKGWQSNQGTSGGRNFIIFLSPNPQKDNSGKVVFNESINITSEINKEASNDAYIQKSKQALQQYLTNYKIVEEKTTTINGRPAYLVGGTFTQNNLSLRSLQLFTFKDNTAYVVTALDLASQWAADSPAIVASLQTFQFPQ